MIIKDTVQYTETDSEVASAILKKLSNHLWYLSEVTVALAFFDSNVSYDEKRKMVAKLKSKSGHL